jgi:hypothetical protein
MDAAAPDMVECAGLTGSDGGGDEKEGGERGLSGDSGADAVRGALVRAGGECIGREEVDMVGGRCAGWRGGCEDTEGGLYGERAVPVAGAGAAYGIALPPLAREAVPLAEPVMEAADDESPLELTRRTMRR